MEKGKFFSLLDFFFVSVSVFSVLFKNLHFILFIGSFGKTKMKKYCLYVQLTLQIAN